MASGEKTVPLKIGKFNIQEMQLNSKVAVIGKPGCFGLGTPVLKFDGSIKLIEEIMPGEAVMGDDGTLRQVLELRRGTEMLYRIVPREGGDPVIVNETHLLVLYDISTDQVAPDITVADYLKLSAQRRSQLLWFWRPVEKFSRFVIPIDETRAWRLGREASSGILESIPIAIRYGSMRVRQNFVRGLLAFHPSYMNGVPQGILNVGVELKKDVAFILRSVGYKCSHHCDDSLNVYFCGINKNAEITLMSLFDISEVGQGDYYGFVIDGNHRFLLGDFSVVRNTGKSTLMKDLLYQHRYKFPIGLVLSETNKESGDFLDLVPALFTYDYYNQTAMDNLVIRQKRMVRKNGEGNAKNFAFVVVDDCMDDTSWVNHKTTKGIFKNGRHWDLFFVLSMQYCLGIPPTLRTCLDYIFLLREPNLRNRKQLWINYASIFPYFEMFCDALDDLTQNYHCMVIKNRVLSNKIEDVCFWYKAVPRKPFRVGKASWWKWAEENYNSRYEQDEEDQLLESRANGADNGLTYGRKRTRGAVRLRVRMED